MKERITVTINKKFLSKLDKHIDNFTFANRSHAFEFLISKGKKDEKK